MSASHREHIESEVVVFVRGEIDMASSSQLWDEIEASVVPGTKHLVLDLSEVSFIDASGVSVITRAWAYLGGDGESVSAGVSLRPLDGPFGRVRPRAGGGLLPLADPGILS